MLGLAMVVALATATSSALAAAGRAQDAAGASFAAQLAALHLSEPLVATGPTDRVEDMALLAAATPYQNRADPDDFSALTGFLAAYPKSAWRPAVLTDLGIDYLHFGYFSRARAAWEEAWREGRDATEPRAKALVDRAVGELVELAARFDSRDRLAALLAEIGTRPVGGSATEMVQHGRETLWVMKTDPRHLYICGPIALKMLLLSQHASEQEVYFLNWIKADGPQGTSLAEVEALSKRAKSPLVPVFRKPGEKAPVPSIVHWRVGHFAAIVGERNGRYEVQDPTFGHQSLWVTQAALDAEASGYFLVSEKQAEAAHWRRVAAAEAGQVWGAGQTNGHKPKPPAPSRPNRPSRQSRPSIRTRQSRRTGIIRAPSRTIPAITITPGIITITATIRTIITTPTIIRTTLTTTTTPTSITATIREISITSITGTRIITTSTTTRQSARRTASTRTTPACATMTSTSSRPA
jgi:hypothetical protein